MSGNSRVGQSLTYVIKNPKGFQVAEFLLNIPVEQNSTWTQLKHSDSGADSVFTLMSCVPVQGAQTGGSGLLTLRAVT